MTTITGGCLCGAVRYEVKGEPVGQAVCHCRHCQRQSGSAFSVLLAVPAPALVLHGPDGLYEDLGESGATVERYFCSKCGSPLYSALPASPDVVFVKAGTLDDPTIMAPRVHVWCDSAWPSTPIPDKAIRFGKNPPAG